MANQLVIYRRERSKVWQCRFKVDGTWQRASTKQRDVKQAQEAAKELMIRAEIRKREGLPVVTRKFRDIAKLTTQRLRSKLANGDGKVSYNDYIRVIESYLIPALGNRLITNIDRAALDRLDAERTQAMGRAPSHSTQLTHNAALNAVFDEAVIRNFLTEASRPKLAAAGKRSDRRAAFDLPEIRALLAAFDGWIAHARGDKSREARTVMRDYVEMLLDTGARPGVELLNLRWRQIKFDISPIVTPTGEVSTEDGDPIELVDLRRTVEMTVSGKTGSRQIIGRLPTVRVLSRIAKRNYDLPDISVTKPIGSLLESHGNDFVLRGRDQAVVSSSFQKMLERFLDEHSLLLDPATQQHRVFYSFRHTYATLALTHDRVPIHTLAQQMGTSVLMIERHYSHLKVMQAIDQLRGDESRRLIANTHAISDLYKSNAPTKATHKRT